MKIRPITIYRRYNPETRCDDFVSEDRLIDGYNFSLEAGAVFDSFAEYLDHFGYEEVDRSTSQKMANWLDELELSGDSRHLIDNTDISLYVEMFAKCEDAQDVEEVCLDMLTYEENGVCYRDTSEEFFAKSFETEHGEELCNFTGRLIWDDQIYRWIPEYEDSEGGLHLW